MMSDSNSKRGLDRYMCERSVRNGVMEQETGLAASQDASTATETWSVSDVSCNMAEAPTHPGPAKAACKTKQRRLHTASLEP